MKGLYRKTTVTRERLTTIARLVVRPEVDAPPNSYRQVQVIVPLSPQIFCAVDHAPQRGFSEDGFGPDRNYTLPFLQPGQMVKFTLLPDQYMVLACETALADATIIVEFLQEG